MRRLAVAAALAATLLAGAIGFARAQVEPLKHHACYANTQQDYRNWYYLPDGTDNCPPGHTKIDWVDD